MVILCAFERLISTIYIQICLFVFSSLISDYLIQLFFNSLLPFFSNNSLDHNVYFYSYSEHQEKVISFINKIIVYTFSFSFNLFHSLSVNNCFQMLNIYLQFSLCMPFLYSLFLPVSTRLHPRSFMFYLRKNTLMLDCCYAYDKLSQFLFFWNFFQLLFQMAFLLHINPMFEICWIEHPKMEISFHFGIVSITFILLSSALCCLC